MIAIEGLALSQGTRVLAKAEQEPALRVGDVPVGPQVIADVEWHATVVASRRTERLRQFDHLAHEMPPLLVGATDGSRDQIVLVASHAGCIDEFFAFAVGQFHLRLASFSFRPWAWPHIQAAHVSKR